jgi:hypothetical protein
MYLGGLSLLMTWEARFEISNLYFSCPRFQHSDGYSQVTLQNMFSATEFLKRKNESAFSFFPLNVITEMYCLLYLPWQMAYK